MNPAIRTKLSVMMFLEYVIWGAWLPLLGDYMTNFLHFSGWEKAWIFNAFAIASLTGMFFGGQLADRYFAQEKFLAFSHLIGGLAMFGLYFQSTFWPFFALMLLHCFFYVPTLSITNAISFANLKDAQNDFGKVRVWGTIGWIAAAWPLIFIPIDWAAVPTMNAAGGFVAWLGQALGTLKQGEALKTAMAATFIVSGVASLILAVFCLTLPHTPPAPATPGQGFAPLRAFRLLAVPAILVLFLVTFLDSLVHYCYFFWTSTFLPDIGLPRNWTAVAMSVGQIAEIATMAYLGWFLKRLGWRTTMILGVLGHVVRFGIYAFGTPETLWLVILSNVVHGFAYAFFFATVYIFVDETFPKDVRTSAQSLFNLLILGLGPFLGNFLWGWLGDFFTGPRIGPGGVPLLNADGTPQMQVVYRSLFLVPAALGLLAALFLAIFFHPRDVGVAEPTAEPEGEPSLA